MKLAQASAESGLFVGGECTFLGKCSASPFITKNPFRGAQIFSTGHPSGTCPQRLLLSWTSHHLAVPALPLTSTYLHVEPRNHHVLNSARFQGHIALEQAQYTLQAPLEQITPKTFLLEISRLALGISLYVLGIHFHTSRNIGQVLPHELITFYWQHHSGPSGFNSISSIHLKNKMAVSPFCTPIFTRFSCRLLHLDS